MEMSTTGGVQSNEHCASSGELGTDSVDSCDLVLAGDESSLEGSGLMSNRSISFRKNRYRRKLLSNANESLDFEISLSNRKVKSRKLSGFGIILEEDGESLSSLSDLSAESFSMSDHADPSSEISDIMDEALSATDGKYHTTYIIDIKQSISGDMVLRAVEVVEEVGELMLKLELSSLLMQGEISSQVFDRSIKILELLSSLPENLSIFSEDFDKFIENSSFSAEVSKSGISGNRISVVSLPRLGDGIVSSDGDLVLPDMTITKSLYLSTSSNVVLNNTSVEDLHILAENAILMGDRTLAIDRLKFRSHFGKSGWLYIDEKTYLSIHSLSMSDGGLFNTGTVSIVDNAEFTNTSIINNGDIVVTSGTASFSDLSYLRNGAKGIIRSAHAIVISAATISNIGELISEQLNIITSKLFSNSGVIEASNSLSITGGRIMNHRMLDCRTAEVIITGARIVQSSDGNIVAKSSTFQSNTTELSGTIAINDITFRGHTAIISDAKVGDIESLTISSSEFLLKDDATVQRIGNLTSVDGSRTVLKSQLPNVEYIHNQSGAELVFLNDSVISPKSGMAGVRNDGHMVIHGRGDPLTGGKLITGNSEPHSDVIISGEYVGTKDSVLEYANGGSMAVDKYSNDGVSFSRGKFSIEESTDTHRYGRTIAEDGMSYTAINHVVQFGSHLIMPVVKNGNKTFSITVPQGMTVSGDVNIGVNIDIHTPSFENPSKLTAEAITVVSKMIANTGTLAAEKTIALYADTLTNFHGRMESNDDITIEVAGELKNTGGGRLEKDVTETITVYVPREVMETNAKDGTHGKVRRIQLLEEQHSVTRDIYHLDLDKAGTITTKRGRLRISAGMIDNSFGIINSNVGIRLTSRSAVVNECGLIRSGGELIISGSTLNNGYQKGPQTFSGVNPNRPIMGEVAVTDRYHMVPNMVWKKVGKRRTFRHRKHRWVQEGEKRENLPDIKEYIITGYERMQQSSMTSRFPGYIFSKGDLTINSDLGTYLGTMVSEADIKIRGEAIEHGSMQDRGRGTVIARGNVDMEMKRAALDQLAIQSENISIRVIEDFMILGVIKPTILPDGNMIHMLDIRKLANVMGIVESAQQIQEVDVRNTDQCGFIDGRPENAIFLPTVLTEVLQEIVHMILTPMQGREILLQPDITTQLEKSGSEVVKIVDGEPETTAIKEQSAILYKKSQEEDVPVTVDGETIIVPLYDPHLLFDARTKLENIIQAHQKFSVSSMGDINIQPGEINVEHVDIDLDAHGKLSTLSNFVYSPSGERIAVEKVRLSSPGNIRLSGDNGVSIRSAEIQAGKTLTIASEHADIVDEAMTTDLLTTIVDSNTAVQTRTTTVTTLSAGDNIVISAPEGDVRQWGTRMVAGDGGITFSSKSHTLEPSDEDSIV